MTKEQIRKLKSVATQLNRLKKILDRAVYTATPKEERPKKPRKPRKKKLWADEENLDEFDDYSGLMDEDIDDETELDDYPDIDEDDFAENDIDYEDQMELEAFQEMFEPSVFDEDDYGYDESEDEDFDALINSMIDEDNDFFENEKELTNRTIDYILDWEQEDEEPIIDFEEETDEDIIDFEEEERDDEFEKKARKLFGLQLIETATGMIENLAKANCPVDTGSLRDNIYSKIYKDKMVGVVVAGVGLYFNGGPRGPINYATYVHEGHRDRGGGWVSGRQFMLKAAESVATSLGIMFEWAKPQVKIVLGLNVSPNSQVIAAFVRLGDSVKVEIGYDVGPDIDINIGDI